MGADDEGALGQGIGDLAQIGKHRGRLRFRAVPASSEEEDAGTVALPECEQLTKSVPAATGTRASRSAAPITDTSVR